MDKICTDIEQSQKLIELGIDRKTSDLYYWCHSDLRIGGYRAQDEELDIPAWTLSALIKMLPSEIYGETIYGDTITYKVDIRKYKLTEDVDLHQIAYGNYKWYEEGNYSWKDMINTGEKESLLDAAFEMIVWLKENKKI